MGYITQGSYKNTKTPKIKLLVCLVLAVLFLSVAVFTFAGDPILIASKYGSRVEYGTAIHQALSRETDSVHVSAYLFNITNAERFLSGEDETLKVQEVGPFTYQENRTNEGLEIDHEAGVIRYIPRHKVTFLPDESVGNPEEMFVTMPNMAMLALASKASSYGYFARTGFNMLAAQLDSSVIVNMSANDYLWGYDEPLIKVGNRFLPGWISFDRIGLLDRLYDNKTIRLEVSSRNEDKFMIKAVNGVRGLEPWGYEDPETRGPCNSFENAYEGFSYPPDMTADRPIKLYRSIFCRFIKLDYQGTKISQYGIEGLHYKVNNMTYQKIPENECLCKKGTCLEGVSDMSPCLYGLPVVLSNAHFLNAEPAVYERIEGLSPNEEQHGSEFNIERTIGLAMTTRISVQVNILVEDVNFNSKISRFSNMIVPLGYFKIIQPQLPPPQLFIIRLIHIYGPYMLLGMQIFFLVTGLLLLSHSARILYSNWLHPRRKVISIHLQTGEVKEVSIEPLMKR